MEDLPIKSPSDEPPSDKPPSGKRSSGRRTLELDGGVRAEVVTGRYVGPVVWIWVPAGSRAPSMVQAAAAVRDALDPVRLVGEVYFLLDGPLVRQTGTGVADAVNAGARRAGAVALAKATEDAAVLVALVEGPAEQAFRIELDVKDERARALARGMGVALLVKAAPLVGLATPQLTLVDGVERAAPCVEAAVVQRTTLALEGLLVSLKLVRGTVPSVPLRVVIKRRVRVDRGNLPGTAQVTVAVGDVVRAGEVLALVGAPGLARTPVVAPVSGVVLSAELSTGGPRIVLGKVVRALARLEMLAHSQDASPERRRLLCGWSEWVGLPGLGVPRLKAKLDTGARTCALHIQSLSFLEGGEGFPRAAELVIPIGRRGRTVTARCLVVGYASVRDSGGHAEDRPVIETTLVLGGIERRVRVSLTNRGDMLFPMLVGRTALGTEFAVDPSARFRFGRRR